MKLQKITLSQLLVVLLLFVFSYSLFAKILNFDQFTADILASPLIPLSLIPLVRFGVPGTELLIIILILSRFHILGFYLAFLSLVVFTTYYILFYRVAESNCGCGKLFESLGFYPHLMLNIVLLGSCIFLIYTMPGLIVKKQHIP